MERFTNLRKADRKFGAREFVRNYFRSVKSGDPEFDVFPSVPYVPDVLRHCAAKKEEGALKQALRSHEAGLEHRITHRYRLNLSQKRSSEIPPHLKLQEKCVRDGRKEMEEIIDGTPDGWTFVQLTSLPNKTTCFHQYGGLVNKTAKPNHDLLVARYSKGKKPIFRLTKNRKDGTSSLFQMLHDVLEDNFHVNETLRTDKHLYWQKRNSHHEEMQEIIRAMELEYLGVWRHLLVGNVDLQDSPSLRFAFDAAVDELVGFGHDFERARLFVNALPYLGIKELVQVFGKEGSLGHEECGNWCRRHEKLKSELKAVRRNPVILIVDKVTQALPWESLHCLKGQSVTRLPSIQLLRLLIERHRHHSLSGALPLVGHSVKLDPLSCYYLLNPAGDLDRVQERLEPVVSALWKGQGKVKMVPSPEAILNQLGTKDLFMYIGHGSGTQFVAGESISKTCVKAAATLFGCSSAKMAQIGPRVEPMGTVIHYLLGGSPVCVGMLWEVTDVDCDKMTVRFLQHWLGQRFPTLCDSEIGDLEKYIDYKFSCPKEPDVGACASLSREAAKSYLNRCALTVYGIPTMSGLN